MWISVEICKFLEKRRVFSFFFSFFFGFWGFRFCISDSVRMSSSEIELQEQLKQAGNSLLNPPSAVDELLVLIDKLELLLANVEQAPSRSMQDALLPPMKALISSTLLRHSDEDVRISVASCMSEITRVTAPDAPYNDDQMKEIFQLTVASFEKLSHESGRGYTKAVSILDNVARVRSCLVMLDLELDGLIIEMFEYFLKFIRSNHPQSVILAMETIMTLVIDESEDISAELLTSLLASVKRQNQNVSSIAWKLGERVMTNCAAKLKLYLKEAVRSMGIPLDGYAPVVASIFRDESQSVEFDYSNGSGEHSTFEEKSPNAVCPGKVFEGKGVIPKSISSKETAPTRNSSAVKKDAASRMLDPCSLTKHSKSTDAQHKAELEVKLEMESETVPSKRGWKPNSLMNPEEGYDPWFGTGRKTTKLLREKLHDRDIDDLPSETPVLKKVAQSSPHVSVIKPTGLTPKTGHISGSGSLSPQQGAPAGIHPKRGRPKKKGISVDKDADPSPLSLSKGKTLSAPVEEKASESDVVSLRKQSRERSDSEAKKQNHSKTAKKKYLSPGHISSVIKSEALSEPEEEPLHQSIVVSVKRSDKCRLLVQTQKKRSSLDGTSDEDVEEPFRDKRNKSLNRDGSYLDETPKEKLKRKRTPRKEVSSEAPHLSDKLVGSRIKVWWPMDKRFYEGVVDSYDPIKKKHRILYADGDEEKLNLKRQRWELIDDEILLVQGQKSDFPKPAVSSDIIKKVKGEPKSESRKKSKAVLSSERSGDGSVPKTRARRSAGKSTGGAASDEIVAYKPGDHDAFGPDGGLEDNCKKTAGPHGGSEDGNDAPEQDGGSKDDGVKSFEPKLESRKKSKSIGDGSVSKTRARRSAGKSTGGAASDEIVSDKPVDHDAFGPDGGLKDSCKETAGPHGCSEDGKDTPERDGGSKDCEKSTLKLKINGPRANVNLKRAMPEAVNPPNNGSSKADTESCSFNLQQTRPVSITPSKDGSPKGGHELDGIDESKVEQQGE